MKKFKVYICDFDGTLVDSYSSLNLFYTYSLAPFGVVINDETTYEFAKLSFQEVVEKYIPNKEDQIKSYQLADELVETHTLLKFNKLYAETPDFINFILKNNLTSALVTGNDRTHVSDVLKNLNIPFFFNASVFTKELTKQKPDPEGINKVLEQLNYKGDLKDVCYIGDAYNDFLAAKNAGVTPILIDRKNEFPDSEEYIRLPNLKPIFE